MNKQMNTQHTPTPWWSSVNDIWPSSDELRFLWSQDQRELTLSHRGDARISIQFTKELRKRWDSHDDLVAALQAIASCESHHPQDVVAIARDALAKAGAA